MRDPSRSAPTPISKLLVRRGPQAATRCLLRPACCARMRCPDPLHRRPCRCPLCADAHGALPAPGLRPVPEAARVRRRPHPRRRTRRAHHAHGIPGAALHMQGCAVCSEFSLLFPSAVLTLSLLFVCPLSLLFVCPCFSIPWRGGPSQPTDDVHSHSYLLRRRSTGTSRPVSTLTFRCTRRASSESQTWSR